MMVVVCDTDGDLWRDPYARPGYVRSASTVEPCQEWVPKPSPWTVIACPRCNAVMGKGLRVDYRPDP